MKINSKKLQIEELPSTVAPDRLFQEVQHMETPGHREPANDNAIK